VPPSPEEAVGAAAGGKEEATGPTLAGVKEEEHRQPRAHVQRQAAKGLLLPSWEALDLQDLGTRG
jgi:hypothetical protein